MEGEEIPTKKYMWIYACTCVSVYVCVCANRQWQKLNFANAKHTEAASISLFARIFFIASFYIAH